MLKHMLLLLAGLLVLAGCIGGPAATPTATSAPAVTAPPSPAPTQAPAASTGLPVLAGDSMPVLSTGSEGLPWWNDTVFYEIFVRSFADSDGDGIGDFKGLTSKLDYLNDGDPATRTDLGVRGLWLMPIHPSPSYHGYDITDYYAIHPDYGTQADFETFLAEAHRRGIRVVIDLVVNHTSVEHPWFEAARQGDEQYRDWYIWSDEKPTYLGPWNQVVWHPTGAGDYFYGVFWEGMPDLNYRNPAVGQEMRQVARFWLEDMGVDGFRIDAARYLVEDGQNQASTPETHAWFKDFRSFYEEINPEAMTVGEVWTSIFEVAGYAKGDELDLLFDFELASAMMGGVAGGDGKRVQDTYTIDLRVFEPNQFAAFLTNHDMERAMTTLAGSEEKMKNAAVLLLTTPGVPFIYYGEEIGMQGGKPDELIRTPMLWSAEAQAGFTTGEPWIDLNRGYETRNVAVQSEDPNSLLSLYRTLIYLREDHPALRVGTYGRVDFQPDSLFAMSRSSEAETVLVVLNLGRGTVDEYGLSGELPLVDGTYRVEGLLGEGPFADLTIQAGQFSDYRPLPSLPANTRLILRLVPAG